MAANNTAQPSAKNKKSIIIGVVVAVIAVLAIAFWAWHNTPGFCGTVCHDTMNEHVANYEGKDASGGAGLASVHAEANLTCLDCHDADLNSQLDELNKQVSGTYSMDDLQLGAKYYVDTDKCLSCHEGSYEALAEKTADLGDYNPHAPIHGEVPYCNECHKGHAEQVDICGQCHPNGGQTMVN